MVKPVVIYKPKRNAGITIREILLRMDKYRSKHPNREVFFDGDEFAICYVRR